MALPCDIGVLSQTIVYVISIVFGIVVVGSTAISMTSVDGSCLLNSHVTWNQSGKYFSQEANQADKCHFLLYFSLVACVLYGIAMSVYHVVALRKRDEYIGTQMWVMPFLLVNSLIAVLNFIASSVTSAGIAAWCYYVGKGKDFDPKYSTDSCRDMKKFNYKEFHFGNSYDFLMIAQGAVWIGTVFWIVQVILSVIRYLRNKHLRQMNIYGGDTETIVNENAVA